MPRRRKTNKHLPACVYQKHGSCYFVRNNRWHRIGSTLSEALVEYARILDRPTETMADLLDRFLATAGNRKPPLAAGTLRQYRTAVAKLKPVLQEFSPRDVKPHHVAAIMDEWASIPNMANRCLSVLNQSFKIAVRSGMLNANPCTDIDRHTEAKRDRYITDDEYDRIRRAGNATLRAIMGLQYLTAQRISDVLAMRESDLTDDGVFVKQDKMGKKLCIAWNTALRQAVADARTLHRTRAIILLALPDGSPRSYRGVYDLWDRACAAAGVEDARPNDLRAKALTDARSQGLSAQRLAGHTTEAMTVRYLRNREIEVVDGPRFSQSKSDAT